MRAEARSSASGLLYLLKNGRAVVRTKDLKRHFPFSRRFLYEFFREHPDVLARYREDLAQVERRDRRAEGDPVDQATIAAAVIAEMIAGWFCH